MSNVEHIVGQPDRSVGAGTNANTNASSNPLLPQRHETWRRLSEVLKNVVAPDANATVKSLGIFCHSEHSLTRKTAI